MFRHFHLHGRRDWVRVFWDILVDSLYDLHALVFQSFPVPVVIATNQQHLSILFRTDEGTLTSIGFSLHTSRENEQEKRLKRGKMK
jgi:hypothetical protein